MELIDKDILVKEINERIKDYQKSLNSFDAKERADIAFQFMEIKETRIDELSEILDFVNTLEVKEVDLEKEFDKYTKDISAQDIKEEPFTQLFECAKHFYELGLKAKGE